MIERIIEISSLIITIFIFYLLVPRSKYRKAFISFLIMHIFTWPLGFVVAEMKLICYPSRFFNYATTANFTFEYFIFPVVSALYNLYYPKKSSFLKRVTFTSVIVSILTFNEVILEAYTDTIMYLQWEWYWSWVSMFILLNISYRIFKFIDR